MGKMLHEPIALDVNHMMSDVIGFQYGIDPCQVDGDVRITGLDWTFCRAYVLEYQDVLCGNFGSFTGRKMSIPEFLERYPGGTVDVMDEMYGYNQAWLSGFLNYGSKCFEIQLEFSYGGDFCYLLRE